MDDGSTGPSVPPAISTSFIPGISVALSRRRARRHDHRTGLGHRVRSRVVQHRTRLKLAAIVLAAGDQHLAVREQRAGLQEKARPGPVCRPDSSRRQPVRRRVHPARPRMRGTGTRTRHDGDRTRLDLLPAGGWLKRTTTAFHAIDAAGDRRLPQKAAESSAVLTVAHRQPDRRCRRPAAGTQVGTERGQGSSGQEMSAPLPSRLALRALRAAYSGSAEGTRDRALRARVASAPGRGQRGSRDVRGRPGRGIVVTSSWVSTQASATCAGVACRSATRRSAGCSSSRPWSIGE